ncbi:MAG: TIGR03118 family protein [Proteobacteria bacterium]|nr:MAG: TIGR03118 family protein [Pseudomonadota bacterium]
MIVLACSSGKFCGIPALIQAVARTLMIGMPLWVSGAAMAIEVKVTNLVTDDPLHHPASITDSDLRNAWGMSSGPGTPFWVSNNGTNTSTIYSVNHANAVTKAGLTVTIPGTGPTGQAFAGVGSTAFNGNAFLFVNEDGTISGWRSALGTTAEVLRTGLPNNIYKGVAIGTIGTDSYLYAANFGTNHIDILKGAPGAPDLGGNFTDPTLPAGFAPFNVENINGAIYVTYAKQFSPGSKDEADGPGLGYVSKFSLQGAFVQRIASADLLNAPWGLALAPASFGQLAGDLLIGNFGDGTITAVDTKTGKTIGLNGTDGKPVRIDGLWALKEGNGGSGGNADDIYFSSGPDGEVHGVFGVLTPVPEPSTCALLALGILGLMFYWCPGGQSFSRMRRSFSTVHIGSNP